MGKTEPTKYSENGINGKFPFQPISVSAIMKKLKNGSHFVNIDCTQKFQITNPKFVNFFSKFLITGPTEPTEYICILPHGYSSKK